MQNLNPGSRNYYIYLVRLALRRAGYRNGDMKDVFDEELKRAVEAFQKNNSITADGSINSETWQFLLPYLYGFNRYRIESGDTFYKIAMNNMSTVRLMEIANPGVDPFNLEINSIVTVPYNFDLVPTDVPYSWQLVQFIAYGLKARYPFADVGSVGTSVLGKPLYYIKAGEGEREVFYNASHHANEWITTPLLLLFMERYLKSYVNNGNIGNNNARNLYNTASLYMVPLVNPDGVDLVTGALSMDSEAYKNAVAISEKYPDIPFPDGWKANISGDDLNLNYPAEWEKARQIKFAKGFVSPAPRDYVGTAPLSAKESKIIYDFTKNHNFRLTLSYHTQGEVIYWKFLDYNPEGSFEIAQKFGQSSGYTVETTPIESGYAGYKDWFISEYNLPGYTIEVGRGVNPLPISQLGKIYSDNEGILVQGLYL